MGGGLGAGVTVLVSGPSGDRTLVIASARPVPCARVDIDVDCGLRYSIVCDVGKGRVRKPMSAANAGSGFRRVLTMCPVSVAVGSTRASWRHRCVGA